MRTIRLLFCVLALAFVSTHALPQEVPAPKKITITGKLTRVMAIGGETSGWSVEFKHRITLEGKKVRSVEVTGPFEELEKLKDQSVRASYRHGARRIHGLRDFFHSRREINHFSICAQVQARILLAPAISFPVP